MIGCAGSNGEPLPGEDGELHAKWRAKGGSATPLESDDGRFCGVRDGWVPAAVLILVVDFSERRVLVAGCVRHGGVGQKELDDDLVASFVLA
jgi:hypothetical protein